MYRLVIVEDEYIEREALRTLVDWAAMQLDVVGCFESGEEALAFAREESFELLFTDIRLLGMSGLELSAQILTEMPEVKVIVYSGYSDFEYARKAIRIRAVSYLTKPLDLQELQETVHQTISVLEAEKMVREEAQRLDRLVHEQLPAIREGILERVGHDKVSGSDAAEALQTVGVETDRNVVRRIMAYITAHPEEKLTAEQLAERFHFSPNYIGIAFRKDAGITLTDFVRETRLEKAKELLHVPGSRIGEVAAQVGYPNVSYFCTLFRRAFGMNPGEYREHG